MIPSFGESFRAKLFKRIDNSNEYQSVPSLTFKCRPTNQSEKKNFVLTSGMNTNSIGIYLMSTRLPKEVSVDDKIFFAGKYWLVESVGYYYDSSLTLGSSDLSNEAMINRLPKGIKLV